jgi:hypothetical protein
LAGLFFVLVVHAQSGTMAVENSQTIRRTLEQSGRIKFGYLTALFYNQYQIFDDCTYSPALTKISSSS